MIENVLTLKNASVKVKVTVKTLVSLGVIALAVILPQIFHLAVGGTSGMTYLPMYLPVLIGGCLLGAWWGLGVGVASPVVSFLITLAFGNPMPALARLPFMAAELAAMAAITGAFSGAIAKNGWMAFPAVLLALVGGRLLFLGSVAVFRTVSALSVAVVWAQIRAGLVGLVLWAVVAPFIVMGLRKLILKDEKND